MKNIFKFLFMLAFGVLASSFFVSCDTQEVIEYNGDAKIHFINEEASAFVVSGTGYTDYLIDFGSLNTVSGDNTAKLIVDAANSTAVEGINFQILNEGNGIISNGQSRGKFTVRIFEDGMTQDEKHVTFTLQSSDLALASFKQTFVLTMSLTCPINTFIGDFSLTTEGFFYDVGDQFSVIEDPVNPNQLIIEGFMTDGSDFVVKYNPETYVITFDTQNTGYFNSNYNAYILIRPASDVTKISTFNPCTRKMTIYMDYWMNGIGGWSNQVENFSGI